MTDCGCAPPEPDSKQQRRVLWIALVLNAVMFVVEVSSGLIVQSSGLVADGLDMLSDAAVYAIALAAIGRTERFKANAALFSGLALLVLGVGLLIEVVRRVLEGSSPEGAWMIAISAVALVVNIVVLRLLSMERSEEVHIRAAWIFTRADVVANSGVLIAGIAVWFTENRYFDLVVGAAIGAYVIREASQIISEAQNAKISK